MPRKIKISYTEDKLEMLFLNSEEMVKETNIMRGKITVIDAGKGRS